MNNHHVYQYHLNLFNQSHQQEIEHYIDADMELCAQEQYVKDLLDSLPIMVSYYSFIHITHITHITHKTVRCA